MGLQNQLKITGTAAQSTLNQAVNMSVKGIQNSMAVISDSDNIREVEPVNMHIHNGKIETTALVDLGSVCDIINRSLGNAVELKSQEIFWVQSP